MNVQTEDGRVFTYLTKNRMEDNYKIRREKEIKVCEELNNMSCDNIKNGIYKSIPIQEGYIMTLTLVYSYILNKEMQNRGLEKSKIVLDTLRPFRSKLYPIIKESYKRIEWTRTYKSAI